MALCPLSHLRIWPRDTGSTVPSHVSLLITILRLNLVLTYGIHPDFASGVLSEANVNAHDVNEGDKKLFVFRKRVRTLLPAVTVTGLSGQHKFFRLQFWAKRSPAF